MVNPMIGDQGRGIYRADPAAYVGTKASLVNFLGAAVSLALVIGLCLWGYQTIMRDVSGVVVLRKMEGPMREAPESPGGTIATNLGLGVNAVQAEGVAEAPADTLVLAPEIAVLTDEDQPIDKRTPKPRETATGTEAMTTVSLLQDEEPVSPDEIAKRLVDELTIGEKPFAPVDAEDENEELAGAPVAEPTPPRAKSGVASSPRPAPRPASRRGPATAEIVKVAAGASDTTKAIEAALAGNGSVAKVEIGTRLVQLGAFDSESDARGVWDKLRGSESFRPLMEDKSPVVQEAQSGGRTFYRLRAVGFADLSDARRFCAALVAEKADCIPVVAR